MVFLILTCWVRLLKKDAQHDIVKILKKVVLLELVAITVVR